MANITIVSTTNSIQVDFGDYSASLDNQLAGAYRKEIISFYKLSDRVYAEVQNEKEWSLAYTTTTGCFIIDTIDGVAPTSNADLYTKLIALIQ